MDEVMRDMARDTNLRKQDRRQRLAEEHRNDSQLLENDIDEAIKTSKEEIKELRTTTLQQLAELVERKSSVEAQILQHAEKLAKAYEDMRMEMQVVLDGRLKDLEESKKLLQDVAKPASVNK